VAAAGGPQAVAARFGELRRMLEADTTLRVVHLRRRSLLRQYISLRRALAGDAWAQPGPPAPLRLSAADCREAFERTTQQAANAEAAFARHPVHRLWYEDLCADPARVLAAVAGFLGLADRPVRPSVPHGPPAPLRECVENLDALRGAFGGTPWAAQFD
jgi:LPS sulfotransferase NodH